MNEDKNKLAAEISEILKDKSLSTKDRLIKMKAILSSKILEANSEDTQVLDEKKHSTYDSKDIKIAAIRNQLLNKNQK